MTGKPPSSQYTCSDYRDEMRLMALKRTLEKETLSAKETKELEREVKLLEEKMGMD